MILISHRGNLNGINSDKENSPSYLLSALNKGFNVEVDVRFEKNKFYLGHDFSQFEINKDFLQNKSVWCHAKTHEAVIKGKWNFKEYKKELFEIFYNKKFNFFSYYLSRFKF